VLATHAVGGPLNASEMCGQAGCRTGPAQRRPTARSLWFATVRSGSTTLGRQHNQTGSYSVTAAQRQCYEPLVRHRYIAQ
jgi:hypothetical protein